VRWSNLSVDSEERAVLPGYRDGALVRHFEAPGSISTRFYEVRAKSILNRVPAESRMPFRWTINPYRGCSHACNYCVSGDTRVLMADGRTREIKDLTPGDRIIGTKRIGAQRRFVATVVHDKWSSIKPAIALELADGTELVASADHRFLTPLGFKHVLGAQRGPQRRPHLTVGQLLLGPGGHATPPDHDRDYQRGYLAAVLRARPSAVDEHAVVERCMRFLTEFAHVPGQPASVATHATDRDPRAPLDWVGSIGSDVDERLGSPPLPTESWSKGFLAACFDVGQTRDPASCGLIAGDIEVASLIVDGLDRLGFESGVDDRDRSGTPAITLCGGLSERMRFLGVTDPASGRGRTIDGEVLTGRMGEQIVGIRPLGVAMRLYDITTGTGDFIANGVVSHNCFARPTHTYLDFDAGRDFEREIVVKINAPEVLRAELARPSWKGEHVALGTNTDPYQWVEGRYKLMPGIWEALRDARNECSVLTKSPLLLRDIGLMQEINERVGFSAALSIPTIDEQAWRATEPHSPNPRARIEAVAELTRVGIRTGILVAPLMPGINDSPAQVEEILRLADEAGAAYVTGIPLHLRGEVRKVFFDWLRESRPELLPRYERLYRRGAYAPPEERRRLLALLRAPTVAPATNGSEDGDWMQRGRRIEPSDTPADREPLQQSLF
jgi:DNA repair photolyase